VGEIKGGREGGRERRDGAALTFFSSSRKLISPIQAPDMFEGGKYRYTENE